jgi:hypothetical protein
VVQNAAFRPVKEIAVSFKQEAVHRNVSCCTSSVHFKTQANGKPLLELLFAWLLPRETKLATDKDTGSHFDDEDTRERKLTHYSNMRPPRNDCEGTQFHDTTLNTAAIYEEMPELTVEHTASLVQQIQNPI